MRNKSVKKRKRMSRMEMKEQVQFWTLCMPSLLKVLIFSYIPMIWLTMAFQFYIPRRGILYSKWVGFDNFNYLLKSEIASRLIVNSISLNVLGIIFSTVVSILLGLFLYEITSKIFLKGSQTVLIFPYFVSWPLVGVLVSAFLSERTGMLTDIASVMLGERIDFYSDPKYWQFIITFCNVWKSCGLSAITYYAVLTGVDKEIYEAAQIDGANKFQSMWHVSLPALKLMVVLNTIMSSANILRVNFDMVYYVTNNSPSLYSTTDVIETYMFRATRTEGDYSVGTATGLLQGVVGLVLTLITNKVSKKISGTSLF